MNLVKKLKNRTMDQAHSIVIVGAGIAGLATALGLHRKGIRSLVLESSENLRSNGFAFMTWTNGWKALDALGIGEKLRHKHLPLQGWVVSSVATGLATFNTPFSASINQSGSHEMRCMKRKLLLETLAQELPKGTIRFGSKVVSIEQSKNLKLLQLADGFLLKAKILIGCDGVNSLVSKWLGLSKPNFTGRSAVRGLKEFPQGHGFKPEILQCNSFRYGLIPCDEKHIYWFCSYSSSPETDKSEKNPLELKQFVLSKLEMASKEMKEVVGKTEDMFSSPLRYRKPWEMLWGKIFSEGVCVAGDALHPMTPDLGQGACSSLEDGVVLARCLGEAFSCKTGEEGLDDKRVKQALEKYANERKWRSFNLILSAFVVGWFQQMDGRLIEFAREKWLAKALSQVILKKTYFDPETL